MSSPRMQLARQVRDQLMETERSNEQSLAASSRLLSTLADAGVTLGAALEVGHDVMENAYAALSAKMEARRRLVAAHGELAALAQLIGIDIKATGGAGSKAHEDFFTRGEGAVVEIGRAA